MGEYAWLSKAEKEDRQILFEWRNDLTTRNSAFSTGELEWGEHCQWFERVMQSNRTIQLIYRTKLRRIGQIRIEMVGKDGVIDYSIAPECRKKGWGKKIIRDMLIYVEENTKDVCVLRGLVKKGNVASNKCFEANGFMLVNTNEQYMEWEKRL